METPPQHFPTDDGTFQGVVSCPSRNASCRPLKPSSGGSRQKYNDAAAAALDEAPHVPIVLIWDDLASVWDEHPGCAGEATDVAWQNDTHAVYRLSGRDGEFTGEERPVVPKMDCSHVMYLRSATHRIVMCKALKTLSAVCPLSQSNAF